jgi:hypothetical protein
MHLLPGRGYFVQPDWFGLTKAASTRPVHAVFDGKVPVTAAWGG